MKASLKNSDSRDELFIWLIHNIADIFQDHAILKGGMALRLLESPRMTNDLDYTFIPYTSKKEILPELKSIVAKIPGARTEISLHSKALRINIYQGENAIQIEASVAKACKAQPISTREYAERVNERGKIIRIMSFDVALAHKLAAWNERRLIRDLYDIYYLYKIIGVLPDISILMNRLSRVESRIPKLRKIKKMSLTEFLIELKTFADSLTNNQINEQLSPLMVISDLTGLYIKIKAAINELIEKLTDSQ